MQGVGQQIGRYFRLHRQSLLWFALFGGVWWLLLTGLIGWWAAQALPLLGLVFLGNVALALWLAQQRRPESGPRPMGVCALIDAAATLLVILSLWSGALSMLTASAGIAGGYLAVASWLALLNQRDAGVPLPKRLLTGLGYLSMALALPLGVILLVGVLKLGI